MPADYTYTILEFDSSRDFPTTGSVDTIYIDTERNLPFRWNGEYIQVSTTDSEIWGILGTVLASGGGGGVPYTGATNDLDLGVHDLYVNEVFLYDAVNDNHGSIHYTDGDFHIEDADGHKLLVIEDGFMQLHKTDTIQSNLYTSDLTATRDHYLPDASGTIALTSDLAGKQDTLTLTTTGTSGAATLVGATLNIPQYSGGGGGLQGAQIQFNNNGGNPTVFGFNAALISSTTGTFIPTASRLDVYPITPNKTLTNVSLTINVSTLGVGSLARLVVYSNSNSFPTTKLFESTDINCSTIGDKTVLTGLTFTAGTSYWLGFYSNGIAQFRTISVGAMLPIFWSSLTTPVVAWSRISTALGTAPTTFNYNTYSSAAQINILIKQV